MFYSFPFDPPPPYSKVLFREYTPILNIDYKLNMSTYVYRLTNLFFKKLNYYYFCTFILCNGKSKFHTFYELCFK